jgi:hypothetical protein
MKALLLCCGEISKRVRDVSVCAISGGYASTKKGQQITNKKCGTTTLANLKAHKETAVV